MTRIALFGGSFNPPHVAHQLVALYVLETCEVDELWFVPTYVHPFGKPLVAYDDRLAMCELAAAALGPRAKVSRAEEALAKRPGFVASRTLELVDMLMEEGGRSFRLVIGTDILGETSKWYRWDELVKRAPPIVIGRTGHPLPPPSATPEAEHEVTETGVAMPEISATRIRELLAARDPHVAALLPRGVLRYIASHGLYT
jgi:nicotinate-nucleotide adenylyltransferase